MAITVHAVHAIKTPSATISQITSSRPSPGTERLLGQAAGFPYPLFRSIAGQKPVVDFSTPQLATLLGLTGLTGADISGGNTDIEFKKMANFGVRTANASTAHKRLRVSQSMLCWSTIRATHQGIAQADCQLVAVYDGTNEPIIPAGSVALAGASAAAEHFTCGPVQLNSGELDDVQEITIQSGVRIIVRGTAGEIWPRFCAVQFADPIITVKTLAQGVWESIGLDGLAISSLAVYLRKKSDEGTNVANATTAHIKFTGTNGLATVDEMATQLAENPTRYARRRGRPAVALAGGASTISLAAPVPVSPLRALADMPRSQQLAGAKGYASARGCDLAEALLALGLEPEPAAPPPPPPTRGELAAQACAYAERNRVPFVEACKALGITN